MFIFVTSPANVFVTSPANESMSKYFLSSSFLVTGKTHNENLADMNHPGLTAGQEIIRPLDDPVKATGHLQIMYGNLCPGGGVAKITGKEGETFTVSYDSLWFFFFPSFGN